MDDPFLERLRRGLEPDFEVERTLGSGGQAMVYLAREVALGRDVAIKTVSPELATAVAAERSLREARALAALGHPNIVPIYRFGALSDGIPYIVMQYLAGDTLERRLEGGPLPPEEVMRIGRDVLSALEAAHGLGIVHRDIKPSNLFLEPGRTVLADFGIAKVPRSPDEPITKPDRGPGTPQYASPEQLAGADVGPASDFWSLGAVLYEALTGRVWTETNPVADPRAGNWAGVPRGLRKALQHALAFAAADRWPDAAAFQRALGRRLPSGRLAQIAAGMGAVVLTAVAIVVWLRPPVPDVGFGRFRSANPGDGVGDVASRLRQVAFDVLRNAAGLTLAPMRDNDGDTDRRGAMARYEVTGVVDSANGRLSVTLQVGGKQVTVTGDSAEYEWDLGRKVALAVLEVAKPAAFVAPACKPRSVEAFNAWSRGQEALWRDEWATAVRLFEEAVARDPEFCLATFRLWLAQRWSRNATTVRLDSLLARHGARLARPDSLIIAAELAPTRERRYELYARAVREDPFSAVAPLLYGSDLTHRGPLDGLLLDSGAALLREAREREPRLAPVHDQLMWALIRLGQRDSARAALGALETSARLAGRRDGAWREGTRGGIQREVDPAVFRLAWAMRFLPRDSVLPLLESTGVRAGEQIAERVRLALSFDLALYQATIGARLAAAPESPPGTRLHGRTAAGLGSLAIGRPAAGLAELDSVAVPGGPGGVVRRLQAAQWRLLASSLGVVGVPDTGATAAAARAALEQLMADSVVGGRALWTLALDAWGRGMDLSRARALAARVPTRDTALRALLAAVDSGRHAPQRALAITRPLRGVREEQERLGDPFARAILHLRRAEWLRSLGDDEDAARELRWHENSDFVGWLQGPIQAAEVDWVAGAYVRVREGTRRVLAGDLTACADLRRVVDTLWIDAEPGVDSLRRAGRDAARRCP